MTEKTTDENNLDQPSADEELKKRLSRRIAVAAVLVVALLGGLAMLDSLNAPPPATPVAEAPVAAVAEPKPAEAKPDEKPVEQGVLEEPKKVEEVPAEPEKTSSPSAPVKAERHGRGERPERPERPLTKPAEARQAMLKPSDPAAALALARPQHAPASRPLTHPPSGIFLLQLGVFNSTANAEELRAKLELNGIPSQIEARVQVGPFKTRLETEQMRDKLKKLGMEPGLVVAVKKQ